MAEDNPKPTPPAKSKPRRPRRSRRRDSWWKRYLRRLTVLAVVLLLVLGVLLVVVQLVLWSGIPRDIAVSTIRSQTGLDTSVGAVELSLMGGVSVREIALTLPETAVPLPPGADRSAVLADPEPFARVDAINAKLPPLPLVAVQFLFGKPAVNLVDIDGITLDARQYEDGTWNLVRIAQQVQRTQAKPKTEPAAQGLALPLSLPLPKIDLRNITLNARDRKGAETTIKPISVLASSDEPLHWTFEVLLPETTAVGDGKPLPRRVHGELVPAGRFDHIVEVELPALTSLAAPLIGLPDVDVSVKWAGSLAAGVDGKLHLKNVALPGGITLTGDVRASAATPGGPLARAQVIRLVADNVPQVGKIVITSGTLVVDGDTVRLTDGRARLLGGTASVRSAEFDIANFRGEADLNLDRLTYAGNQLNGDATLTVDRSQIDGLSIALAGDFDGNSIAGPFAASIDVTGTGDDFAVLDWTANLTDAAVDRAASDAVAIPNLTAELTTQFTEEVSQVLLTSLATRDSDMLSAFGGVTLSGERPVWWLYGKADGFEAKLPRVPEAQSRITLDAIVDVWGELAAEGDAGQTIRIDQLYAKGGGLVVSGDGSIMPGGAVNAELNNSTFGTFGETVAAALPLRLDLFVQDDDTRSRAGQLIDGNIRGKLAVDGNLDARNWFVDFDGQLRAMNLTVAGQVLDDIGGDVAGSVNPRLLEITTDNVRGLGGTAMLDLVAPLDDSKPIRGTAMVTGIELAQVGKLANLPPLDGVLNEATVELSAARLAMDALRVDGTFDLGSAVRGVGIGVGPLVVGESIAGTFRMRGFDASANDVTIISTDGQGTLAASAFVSLNDLKRIVIDAQADNYIVDVPAARNMVDIVLTDLAADRLVVEFVDGVLLPNVEGAVTLRADVNLASFAELISIDVDAVASDRALKLNDLLIAIATCGELKGEGEFPFDDPSSAEFELIGEALDLSPLIASFAPDTPLSEVSGIWDIDVHLRPAEARRPLAPLQLDVDVDVTDGSVKGMSVEGFDLRAFGDMSFLDEAERPAFVFRKFVTEYAIARVADGSVDTFLRINRKIATNPEGQSKAYLQTLANIEIGGNSQSPDKAAPLDVGQLVGIVNPKDIGADGLLTGNAAFRGDLLALGTALRRVQEQRAKPPTTNETEAETEPDTDDELLDVFAGNGRLNLTELAFTGPIPETIGIDKGSGGGTVGFDFFRGNFRARDINLTVAKVQVRGAFAARDVLLDVDPELGGGVVALARPLSDIGLPFLSNADDMFSALQNASGLNAFRISGTLAEPKVEPALFAELGDQTQKLLVGDAQDSR